MKVALVAEWLDAWRGGAETSTLQFMNHLVDRGVSVHLFTRSRPSPRPGLSVHTIPGASMSRTRQSMTFTHRVDRLLRRGSFDIIHAISPCRCADIYQPRGGLVAETVQRNLALRQAGAARTLKRCANQLNFKQRFLLSLERKILAPAERPVVVAVSDYVVRQLRDHYRLSDGRVRKVYNGVDPDTTPIEERRRNRATIRGEFGLKDGESLVILVAHNFRLKGVHRWMEALAGLLKRGVTNIRSLVIGKGESQRWHRLAHELGIDRHLTFIGPSERVPAFRHAADALVHPTYYDPCSRVVLEAMVGGLPVVTTRWDGASEMVEEGRTGFVIDDPDRVEVLAEKVERLCQADMGKSVGEAASSLADKLSMVRHAREMTKLYEELVREPTGQV